MRLPLHLRQFLVLVLLSGNSLRPAGNLRAAVDPAPATLPGNASGNVAANHTGAAGMSGWNFSSPPTDDQIFHARALPEPLVPVGKPTTPAENTALAQALNHYEQFGAEDLTPFTDFLSKYPDSAWAASLHLDLGLRYFATAWFSKALVEYADAWTLSKDAKDARGHAIADRAIGELLELNARFGRYDVLEKLLPEIANRPITGSASELVAQARQGLWLMENQPGDAFRCGPGALDRILAHQNGTVGFNPILTGDDARSTSHGLSLTQVWKLSHEVGLNYQMAKRTPGAAVLAPAVVNWKVGHYSALLSVTGDVCHLEDPTFGAPNSSPYTATKAALDAEASGYFLVSSGPLPPGWQPVSETEGDTVFGKGAPSGSDPNRTRPYDPRTCPNGDGHAMAVASATLMVCSLNLTDTPLFYAPPVGPAVNFTLTYNQREAGQPTTFDYGNVGNKWTFGWLSFIDEVRNLYSSGPPALYTYTPSVRLIGGGTEPYPASSSTADADFGTSAPYTFPNQADSHVQLTKTDVYTYTQINPDGSTYIYGGSAAYRSGAVGNWRYFLHQIVDPQGNALTLGYDNDNGSLLLTSVTDALGRTTVLSYNLPGDPLKLTQVTDPFNRTCQLGYTNGQLTSITDMIGITSQFTYKDGSDFINSLKTPYGTSTFSFGEDGQKRWLILTDPDGNSERVEYDDNAAVYPAVGTVPTGMNTDTGSLNYRNTFYWDKRAYHDHPGDVTAAHAYHWLHNSQLQCSGTLGNEKKAMEGNRIWYNYQGQTSSDFEGTSGNVTAVGQALDSTGTAELYKYANNSFGHRTSLTDPNGRITTYVYNSAINNSDGTSIPAGIDLLEVHQTTATGYDVVAKFTYNTDPHTGPLHVPLTATDASGETTTYTYNGVGQVSTVTDAKGHITTFYYDPAGAPNTTDVTKAGYLVDIVGPTGGITALTYYDDTTYRLVHTLTNPEGYTFTYAYDKLNRITQITYPDGTTDQIDYQRLNQEYLDPQLVQDRLGRVTLYRYNALRQLAAVTDPLGRITRYDWCGCGALASITDPAGNMTNFGYDTQGRLTGKTYADGRGYIYAYDPATSRLQTVTDALNQVARYVYYNDGLLKSVTYTNTVNPTPGVTFGYDSYYPRITTMTDGVGTTGWFYFAPKNTDTGTGIQDGANQLETFSFTSAQTVNNLPVLAYAIGYQYDALGRATDTNIDSANDSSVFYDALGRIQTATNPLGEFDYFYVSDVSGRLDHVIYPNGQRTNFGYYPISAATPGDDDLRLSQIQNLAPGGANLSTFGYDYDAAGRILKWTKQLDADAALTSNFTYDAADQLIEALVPASPTASTDYVYAYDRAGNRTSEQIDNAVTGATVNNLNQLTQLSPTGSIRFSGTIDEPATVTVNGVAAKVAPDAANNNQTDFSASVTLSPGTNTVAVAATNGNNVTTTKHFQYTVANGVNRTLTYDLDGNLTDDGNGNTYTFDAANRLISVTNSSGTSKFVYDGLGHRIQQTDANGNITKQWVWCPGDAQPGEERDASNNVTKRFYAQGEQIAGTSYYFTKDHLGSIREMTDSSGAIRARYDYDPFGRTTKVSGDLDADFRFQGMYYHTASGLYFTLTRIYDPNLDRWLTRDTIGEAGGINLYRFVGNNPVNKVDPLGLWASDSLFPVHQYIIDRALAFLPDQSRQIIKDAQVTVDKYQGSRDDFMHAMKSPNDSLADAVDKTNAFIAAHLRNAQQLRAEGKCDASLKEFGYALHAVQDSSSPAHAGFQEWSGNEPWINELAHVSLESTQAQADNSSAVRDTHLLWGMYDGKIPIPSHFFNNNGTRNF